MADHSKFYPSGRVVVPTASEFEQAEVEMYSKGHPNLKLTPDLKDRMKQRTDMEKVQNAPAKKKGKKPPEVVDVTPTVPTEPAAKPVEQKPAKPAKPTEEEKVAMKAQSLRKVRQYWLFRKQKLERLGFVQPNFEKLTAANADLLVKQYQLASQDNGLFYIAPKLLFGVMTGIEKTSIAMNKTLGTTPMTHLSSDVLNSPEINDLLIDTILEEVGSTNVSSKYKLLMAIGETALRRYEMNSKGYEIVSKMKEKSIPANISKKFGHLISKRTS